MPAIKLPARLSPAFSCGLVFGLALILYVASAGITLLRQSLAPHYAYLAYSMLHGQFHLDPLPPTTYDLLLYQNRWYVAGSPMPALLLMPAVALNRLAVSDILFGVIVGAVNVALIYELFGQLASASVDSTKRRWLTMLFAAGTVHWYIAVLGSVWFNAHVVTVSFMILYVREALMKGRGWLAGLWLTMAGLARPAALFAATFFVVYVMVQAYPPQRMARQIGPFLLTLSIGTGVLLAYNVIRFGNALDFGYAYVQGAANITDTYARWGGFNIRYLPCNLYVSLAGLPDISGRFSPIAIQLCRHLLPAVPLAASSHWLSPNPLGMSTFLTTPALLYLFRARSRNSLVVATWVGLWSVMVPLWMYHNTGSLQFGYRYSLDAAPFWMILIAVGMKRLGRWERGAIILSVLINFLGMTWMFQAFNGFSWFSMWR